MAVRGSGEGYALAFQIDDGFGSIFGEQLGRVLVDEPVAALDGVVVMPMPVIMLHIAQCGGDAAFGGAGVRAQGLEFGDHEDLRSLAVGLHLLDGFGSEQSQCRGQAGRSGADDHRIIHIFQVLRTHTCYCHTRGDLSRMLVAGCTIFGCAREDLFLTRQLTSLSAFVERSLPITTLFVWVRSQYADFI